MTSGDRIPILSACLSCLLLSGCSSSPVVEFTEVPEAGPGDAGRTERIAGRVTGAKPGQRLVLFARSGTWWVQPLWDKPFTSIRPGATWNGTTHTRTEYAAILVG